MSGSMYNARTANGSEADLLSPAPHPFLELLKQSQPGMAEGPTSTFGTGVAIPEREEDRGAQP
jgi:hypothetical protein